MKITIVAWIGSSNIGDDLILRSLITLLQGFDISLKDITAISSNPERTTAEFGVKSVGHLDFLAIHAAMRASDVIVFGGGGLIQDETSAWNLPYYYSKLWLARLLKKRITTIGVGVGPLGSSFGRWLTKKTFDGAQMISVRDHDSGQQLARLGIQNVIVSPDLAFGLPPVDVESAGYVAVSLRNYAPHGRLLSVGMQNFRVDEDRLRTFAHALDEVHERTGLAIRFVSLDSKNDVIFHEKVAEQMKTGVTLSTATMESVFEQIGAATVVVAMRFHAGVVATLAGRPSVLIGYSPKIFSLGKMIGQGCSVLPNEPSAIESLPQLVVGLLHEQCAVRAKREELISAFNANKRALSRYLGKP